jgi:hypothetical protein
VFETHVRSVAHALRNNQSKTRAHQCRAHIDPKVDLMRFKSLATIAAPFATRSADELGELIAEPRRCCLPRTSATESSPLAAEQTMGIVKRTTCCSAPAEPDTAIVHSHGTPTPTPLTMTSLDRARVANVHPRCVATFSTQVNVPMRQR